MIFAVGVFLIAVGYLVTVNSPTYYQLVIGNMEMVGRALFYIGAGMAMGSFMWFVTGILP